MNQTAEAENLMVLSGDDERFIEKAKSLSREMHREVYRCLTVLSELDAAFDCLSEDDEETINSLRENWASWHAEDLKPDEPKTLNEYQVGVVDELVEKTEGLLSQFLPGCQAEVIKKLAARLPKCLADDELAELRDAAACAVGDGIINNGLPLKTQIALFKQLKIMAEKTVRGLNVKRK
jgi:hypothetical protein